MMMTHCLKKVSGMVTMFAVIMRMGVFGTMGTIVPMPWTMKKPKWSIGILIDTFRGGDGEGLAAMGGYQSGA